MVTLIHEWQKKTKWELVSPDSPGRRPLRWR